MLYVSIVLDDGDKVHDEIELRDKTDTTVRLVELSGVKAEPIPVSFCNQTQHGYLFFIVN